MKKILTLMVLLMGVVSGYGQVEDMKKAYREKIITQTLQADNKYDLLTKWWGQQTHIFHYDRETMQLSEPGDQWYRALRHCVRGVIVDKDTTYFVGLQGCVYAEECDVRLMVAAIDKMQNEVGSDCTSGANETFNKFVTEDGLEISYKTKKGKAKEWLLNSPMVGFEEIGLSTKQVKVLRDALVEDLKFIDGLKKTRLMNGGR